MRIIYRLGQFWRILTAEPLPTTVWNEISAVLSDAEIDLFGRFTFADQWHSYHVLCALREAGHTQADLLAAALLHDVGKTCTSLSVWERSLIVLFEVLWPQKAAGWGRGQARGWKRPFVVKAQHPSWGAAMARAAGSSPLTVSLICRHQEKLPATVVSEEDNLLCHLQWADDQN